MELNNKIQEIENKSTFENRDRNDFKNKYENVKTKIKKVAKTIQRTRKAFNEQKRRLYKLIKQIQ